MELKKVYKANSVDEVINLLDKYGDNGKIIAGGTDLVIDIKHDKLKEKVIIDISSIDEISKIEDNGDYIELGAATTFTNTSKSNKLNVRYDGLKKAAKSVGSPQIRNKGTIGGNICNGSPAADTVPPLLSLDAVAVIKSKDGKREVKLEEIFLDKGKVDLKDDEFLYSVKFKKLAENEGLGFSKLGLRKALAISRICTSVYVKINKENICEDIRIANGAVGRYGLREREVEDFLKGKQLNDDIIIEASQVMEDVIKTRLKGRSSMEFKGEAIRGTFKDAIKKAITNGQQ
ncbi:FAD binding domain-containing protein [Dethiothermospora halolimnae]|uniref:FAD binding domain-containing protein n=1 Tax=Dethiothermospora halolimnae TaxID=3114390 RepID=UPI003CCBE483